MNLRTLMTTYRSDPISGFYKLEYCTRRFYDRLMAQVARTWWIDENSADRSLLPATGPVIIDEYSGLPYKADDFREEWRIFATDCGVPLNVQNRDARAGAISEAIMYGAEAAHVRDAATHSDVSQTMDYSRASRENTHTVQRMRMEKSKGVG